MYLNLNYYTKFNDLFLGIIEVADCLEAICTAEIALSASTKAMLRHVDIIYTSVKDMYTDMEALYHDLKDVFEELEDIFETVVSAAKAEKTTFDQKKIISHVNMLSSEMTVVYRSMKLASLEMKSMHEGCKNIHNGVKGIYCSMESFSTYIYRVCRDLETVVAAAEGSSRKSKGSPLSMKTLPINIDETVSYIKCMRYANKRAYVSIEMISFGVQMALQSVADTFDAMTCTSAHLEDLCVDVLKAVEGTEIICKR